MCRDFKLWRSVTSRSNCSDADLKDPVEVIESLSKFWEPSGGDTSMRSLKWGCFCNMFLLKCLAALWEKYIRHLTQLCIMLGWMMAWGTFVLVTGFTTFPVFLLPWGGLPLWLMLFTFFVESKNTKCMEPMAERYLLHHSLHWELKGLKSVSSRLQGEFFQPGRLQFFSANSGKHLGNPLERGHQVQYIHDVSEGNWYAVFFSSQHAGTWWLGKYWPLSMVSVATKMFQAFLVSLRHCKITPTAPRSRQWAAYIAQVIAVN